MINLLFAIAQSEIKDLQAQNEFADSIKSAEEPDNGGSIGFH